MKSKGDRRDVSCTKDQRGMMDGKSDTSKKTQRRKKRKRITMPKIVSRKRPNSIAKASAKKSIKLKTATKERLDESERVAALEKESAAKYGTVKENVNNSTRSSKSNKSQKNSVIKKGNLLTPLLQSSQSESGLRKSLGIRRRLFTDSPSSTPTLNLNKKRSKLDATSKKSATPKSKSSSTMKSDTGTGRKRRIQTTQGVEGHKRRKLDPLGNIGRDSPTLSMEIVHLANREKKSQKEAKGKKGERKSLKVVRRMNIGAEADLNVNTRPKRVNTQRIFWDPNRPIGYRPSIS